MTIALHTHADPRWPYGGRRHRHPTLLAPALAVDDIAVVYPGTPTLVLHDCTLVLPSGSVTALVGPNGAGKSTLLQAIAGLLRPSHGTIRVFGLPPGACHHRTAYLPQRTAIDWAFPITVERFVLSGRYVHLGWFRWPRRNDHLLVKRTLDQLGLAALAQRHIRELSGGQQQRAFVARALVQGADLLLLDEPFNHLDAAARQDLLAIFHELRAANKTLLLATHETGLALEQYDRVLRLSEGQLQSASESA